MKSIRIPAMTAACFLLGLVTIDAAVAASFFRAKLTSGMEVIGELTDFRDGYYEFQVGQSVRRIRVEDLAALSQVDAVQAVQAAPPGGESRDGKRVAEFTLRHGTGQSVTGRITQFQDGYYDVATRSGNVRVAAADVTHVLVAWQQDAVTSPADVPAPRFAKLSGHLRIRSSPEAFEKILPNLLQFYAEESGQAGKWSARRPDGSRTYDIGAADGTKGLQVDLQIDDPKTAVAAVLSREADLAFVGDVLPDGSLAPAPAAGGESPPAIEVQRLGPSAAVVIVNADNPVEQLTADQVAAIFSGRITDWSELGGPHRRIRVHSLAHRSGLDLIARRAVKGDGKPLLSAYQENTLSELSEIVSSDPTAISLTEAAHIGSAKALKIVDHCGIARAADEFTLKLNAYPMSGAYAVYSAPDANPQTQGFREFLRSEVTQNFLKRRGLPNDRIVAVRDPNLNIDVTADTIDTLVPASSNAGDNAIERLSLVFNFDQGVLAPAEGSESKVESLKAFLQERGDQKRRLALVGFSDTFGTLPQNVSVSRARARRVSRLLSAHGIQTEKMLALGPKLPLTCETVPGGAEMNRRVEIWLY